MLKKVILSNRAVAAMSIEIEDHPINETGGIFLGYKNKDIWYVMEMVDPGINCVFTPTNFEYDGDYLNHLMNKINRLYSRPLKILGLWHRHPGSYDSFSPTDDETNITFAQNEKGEIISGIVNIDPEARLTLYHVSLPLKYRVVRCIVGDSYIPPEMFKYRAMLSYKTRQADLKGQKTNKKTRLKIIKEKRAKSSFIKEALQQYLLSEKQEKMPVAKMSRKEKSKEANIEYLFEKINEDIEFVKDMGISLKMSADKQGDIKMEEYGFEEDRNAASVIWIKRGRITLIKFQDKLYRYFPGMIKKAYDFYITRSAKDEYYG